MTDYLRGTRWDCLAVFSMDPLPLTPGLKGRASQKKVNSSKNEGGCAEDDELLRVSQCVRLDKERGYCSLNDAE